MSLAAALAAALTAASAAGALPSDLSGRVDSEPGAFRATAVSLGRGRPVCARATFDPRVAAAGGRVLILDSAAGADDEAVRLSEAVVIRRGGLAGRAALAARRHGVPAVTLSQAGWSEEGPSLLLDEPVYGEETREAGLSWRPVTGATPRFVREGDAMIVDAAGGRVVLLAPEEAEDRVAAAEAARAYDGLRDAVALAHWLDGASPRRSAALLEELIPRALAGAPGPDEFARLRRAAEAGASASGRDRLRAAEARAFRRAVAEVREAAADCLSDAASASSPGALRRLATEARAAATGVAAMARLLGRDDAGAAAAAATCRAAAERRLASLGPRASDDLLVAARAAGADEAEGGELPADAWPRFVADNDLGAWLRSVVSDASTGLRLKSERIRARVLAGRLDSTSPAAAAAMTAAGTGSGLVIGDDGTSRYSGPAELLDKVKESWAASWAPGPLGARLRAGRALEVSGRLRVERVAAADASGILFTRDPSSGRRGRALALAAAEGLDAVLSGRAAVESYAFERASGRPLPGSPAGGALSGERLARLARLARALDAWSATGVEAGFAFSGPRLRVFHARPLEAPAAIVIPAAESLSPRPEPTIPGVRAVR